MKNYTLSPKPYTLTIGWLYPELMSTYGDRGNIIALTKRCEWRGIKVDIKRLDIGYSVKELRSCDLLFMGGAQDRQQKIVSQDLKKKVKVLREMIEDDTPGLYICGAYQFLGRYYKEADGAIIKGLGILDLYTEHPGENHPRLIGNIVVRMQDLIHPWGEFSLTPQGWNSIDTLVGFENHGGRTYLGEKVKPLGKVLVGFGNNGEYREEGAVYKNSFGSYLHGPILPKNPHFADYLIKLALENKYLPRGKTGQSPIKLKKLNDSLEYQAHKAILEKLEIKI